MTQMAIMHMLQNGVGSGAVGPGAPPSVASEVLLSLPFGSAVWEPAAELLGLDDAAGLPGLERALRTNPLGTRRRFRNRVLCPSSFENSSGNRHVT